MDEGVLRPFFVQQSKTYDAITDSSWNRNPVGVIKKRSIQLRFFDKTILNPLDSDVAFLIYYAFSQRCLQSRNDELLANPQPYQQTS